MSHIDPFSCAYLTLAYRRSVPAVLLSDDRCGQHWLKALTRTLQWKHLPVKLLVSPCDIEIKCVITLSDCCHYFLISGMNNLFQYKLLNPFWDHTSSTSKALKCTVHFSLMYVYKILHAYWVGCHMLLWYFLVCHTLLHVLHSFKLHFAKYVLNSDI